MSIHEDWQNEPVRKAGMSSGAKVLLVLGSIAAVCLVVCCGGVIFLVIQFRTIAQNLTTDDPVKIRERTSAIVEIDIPPEFEPQQAMDMVIMKMVVYHNPAAPGSQLMIGQFGSGFGADTPQQRREMLKAMREQQRGRGGFNDDATNTETENREFEIGGEKVSFQFTKHKSSDGTVLSRHVSGAFQGGAGGVVMLNLIMPEQNYNEEAVVRMVESIRVGGRKTVPAPVTPTPEKPQQNGDNP